MASVEAPATAGKPIVGAERDEMGLHEAVGAEAADKKSREQDPEGSVRRDLAEHRECAAKGRRGRGWRRRAGGGRRLAIRGEANVGGTVADEQRHHRASEQQADHRRSQRIAPAHVFDQPRRERQKHQLPGRRTGRQHSEHETAPLGKPARRNDRAQHQRGHAGADADHDSPQRTRCQGRFITRASNRPATIRPIAESTTRRTP